ncbi:DNA polymerase [Tinamou hepatitis B virus]|uniref:Protein P n=1 Tax=Tinamou hepatitis B virus TaxID=2018685 RepID=A0A218NK42_9HEPA|nr:DNA polymerase [Tinamou hepatitis B virus]ASG92656.1 DNA polymerase [Tinamou hepatitis B virus]
MPRPLKQSLDQSKWHREAETKLRELEKLVDLNLEGEKLKPQLSMGEDVLSPEIGGNLFPAVRAPLSHVVEEAGKDLPRLGNKDPARHKLGRLTGLYQMKGCEFNPNWKVPDISPSNFKLEIVEECPSRNWKYLTPAKFWPKSISYFPIHAGVKPKYPDHVGRHEEIVGEYLTKLYDAGILYKRVSKTVVSFRGEPFEWEQQYLVNQPARIYGATSSKINGSGANRRWRTFVPENRKTCGSGRLQYTSYSGRQVPFDRACYGPYREHGGIGDIAEGGTLSGSNGAETWNNQSKPATSTGSDVDTGRGSKSARLLPSISRRTAQVQREPITSNNCSVSSSQLGTSARGSSTNRSKRNIITNQQDTHQSIKKTNSQDVFIRANTSWPNRITGRVFLVDKNSRNTTESRLVVDFSQFSKGKNALRFPRYWSPNLTTLRRILPVGMPRISLDLSQAFYHLPLSPASSSRLAISDGKSVYYFRKAPMGVGISPFLLHLFTIALGSEISRRFNVWTFTYMDDFLLCHPNHRHLNAISHSVCCFLQELGVKINFDKMTPSPTRDVRFLGYRIDDNFLRIEDDRWSDLRGIIKKIKVGHWYDWKCIQRFVGHLNFILPFTKGNIEMLKPMYAAITNQVNFAFSSSYRNLLYKLTMGVCKLRIKPVESLPIPRVATDATPTHGAISHITGGSAVFTFSKVRDIHIQELLMVCLARLMIKPRSILSDSTFVCHKRYQTLPWQFAVLAKQLLTKCQLYFVPSKYNPADGPSRHKPPDWTALTYTPLSKPIYIPHRLCGG